MHPVIHKKRALYIASGTHEVYPLEVNIFNINAALLPCDYEKTLQACQSGCDSYQVNGGCPPYSPAYQELSGQYNYALILYYKLHLSDFPVKLETGLEYMNWSFTESFLPRLLLSTLHSLAKRVCGFVLGSGHCIGCKRCNYLGENKACRKPERRTYSLEAVGVNIVELMEQYSDSPLVWLNQGEGVNIPDYQLRVGAVLHNHQLTGEQQEALFGSVYRRNLRKRD